MPKRLYFLWAGLALILGGLAMAGPTFYRMKINCDV